MQFQALDLLLLLQTIMGIEASTSPTVTQHKEEEYTGQIKSTRMTTLWMGLGNDVHYCTGQAQESWGRGEDYGKETRK